MRAVVYEKFRGPITIKNVKDPDPKPHGVVVEVKATGLCRSDWHGWMGHDADITLPHVPGHELAGIIVAKGTEVKKFEIGDRITVPFVSGCGHCRECISGNEQVCDHQTQPGFTHWGSFAEYVALENADLNLVKLPESISNETAALLGCRFITSYRAVVAQGKVKEGQYVAVHGCGGVGLSAIMIAKAFGAQVVAIDINDENLQLAKEIGAEILINSKQHQQVIEAIRDSSEGGVHLSIDALGSQETCFNSIANLRKRGKHIQVGLMTGDHTHPKVPMDLVVAKELEILGSHGMQAHAYPQMLNLIVEGKLDPGKMLNRTITLDESPEALMNMNRFENKGVTVINKF